MAVYVDNAYIPHKQMLMCHMTADTREEMLEMIDRIGIDRKYVQKHGTYQEHFDIAMSKRKLAVEAGAIEVTSRELLVIMIRRGEFK